MKERRWFASKARKIRTAKIRQAFRVSHADSATYVCLVDVDFTEGIAETYLLPLTLVSGKQASHIRSDAPHAAVALVHGKSEGLLIDALSDPAFASRIVEAIGSSRPIDDMEDVATADASLWPTSSRSAASPRHR